MSSQKMYAAITVYHEARGEHIEGQIAVAHVIFNRALKRGVSVQETVFQKKQFSCYNSGKPPIKDYHSLVIAMEAVERCFEERLHGKNLHGATGYLNKKTVLKLYGKLPRWTHVMEEVAAIGRHTFYADNQLVMQM